MKPSKRPRKDPREVAGKGRTKLSPLILGVMLGSDGLNHFWARAHLRNKRGYVYPYGRRRLGQAWSAAGGELEALESQGKNSTLGGDWSDFYKKAKGITGDS